MPSTDRWVLHSPSRAKMQANTCSGTHNITDLDISSFWKVSSTALVDIAAHCTSLTALKLSGCSQTNLEVAISSFHSCKLVEFPCMVLLPLDKLWPILQCCRFWKLWQSTAFPSP